AQARREAAAVLGYVKRTCTCGEDWRDDQAQCSSCGGNIFTESVIAPVPITADPGQPSGPSWIPWRRHRPPEKPAPQYSSEDIDALRRLRGGLAHLETLLIEADLAARRLVNAEHADGKYAKIQATLTEAANVRSGDIDPSTPI